MDGSTWKTIELKSTQHPNSRRRYVIYVQHNPIAHPQRIRLPSHHGLHLLLMRVHPQRSRKHHPRPRGAFFCLIPLRCPTRLDSQFPGIGESRIRPRFVVRFFSSDHPLLRPLPSPQPGPVYLRGGILQHVQQGLCVTGRYPNPSHCLPTHD